GLQSAFLAELERYAPPFGSSRHLRQDRGYVHTIRARQDGRDGGLWTSKRGLGRGSSRGGGEASTEVQLERNGCCSLPGAGLDRSACTSPIGGVGDANSARTSRCWWCALLSGRDFPRLARPEISKCYLARVCVDRDLLSFRCRHDSDICLVG